MSKPFAAIDNIGIATVSRRIGSLATTAANARLIAAAPELLEALKTAVDHDGDLFDREKALVAIAKAEGR